MKQFDLYRNNDRDTQAAYPYFVDVQSALLENLNSRVVIPLVPALKAKSFPQNLCPIVVIDNNKHALMTHQLTTVPASFLADKEGSLLLNRDDIISSLDFLFTGI